MPSKSKKQTKHNYLKIVASSLFIIALLLNLFTWWSSDWWNLNDLRNTLSTTIATFGWSLISPILIFVIIIEFIYFVVARYKKKKINIKNLGWWLVIPISISWVYYVYPDLKNRINPPPDTAPFVTVRGKLVSKDVPKGPGIYNVSEETTGKTQEIDVGPPGSCDDQAVDIPELQVGDRVLIYAKQYDESGGYVSICAPGTYIHKL